MAATNVHPRQSSASRKLANAAFGRLFENRIGGGDFDHSSGNLVVDRQSRQKSGLARPGVPALFLVICFIIFANTNCDQVGGTAAEQKATSERGTKLGRDSSATRNGDLQAAIKKRANSAKYDPLSMLREIYLDHDSKVITMILPPGDEPAAMYHPSTRYGRRSVADAAEPASAHTELGKLTFNHLGSLKSYVQSRPEGSPINNRAGAILYEQQQQGNADSGSSFDDSSLANFQSEIGKLLKCNYLGVSNLYWCDTSVAK